MNILIVGGNLAGITAIHWIRKIDPLSRITLLCDTDFPGYIRGLLPEIALGKLEPSFSMIYPRSFLEHIERVRIIRIRDLGEVSVDNGKITVADKEYNENWDKILVSTGVRAIEVPEKIVEKNREVYPLERVEEALLLSEKIQELNTSADIGVLGSFYGLDIAYKLACMGFTVELFLNDSCRVLDDDMFKILKKFLPSKLLFKKIDWSRVMDKKMIIVRGSAKPLIPRIRGLSIGKLGGIRVDNRMKAAQNIFAAGSVTECLDEKTGISFTHLSDNLSILQGIVSALNIEGFNYRVKRIFPLYETSLGERVIFSAGFTSENLAEKGRNIVVARHHFYINDVASRGNREDIFIKVIADRVTRVIYGVQTICGRGYIHGLHQILTFMANNLFVDDAVLIPPLYIPHLTRLMDPFKATCWGIWRKLLKT